METNTNTLIAISLGLLVLLGIIHISIVVWVHKDASRRGLNAILWTIVVLFTGIPGWIIYLIARPPLPTAINLQQTPPNQIQPVQQQQQVPSSAPTRSTSPLVGCLVAIIAVLLLVIVVAIAVPLVHKKILQNREEVALEARMKQQQFEQKLADDKQEGVRQQAQPQSQQATAVATRDNPFVNSLGMKFVPVPGTKVLFCIWETRVTDFEAFVNATGHEATHEVYFFPIDPIGPSEIRGDNWRNPSFAQGPTHPVCCVSWDDANDFCDWLTKKEQADGRLGPSQKYRLPTDAEWTSAAGFRSGRRFPWGDDWPHRAVWQISIPV